MARPLDYYKGYTALEIAALATEFKKTFFTIIRWIDGNHINLQRRSAKDAIERVKAIDELFLKSRYVSLPEEYTKKI